MNKHIRFKNTNTIIFLISLIGGFVNACFGNVAMTIFCGTLMISCFVDKSGYEEGKDE